MKGADSVIPYLTHYLTQNETKQKGLRQLPV